MVTRFAAAWHAGETGKAFTRDNTTFQTLKAFMAAMPPRRLELMHHLRRNGPMSARRLSQLLSRDYKSVHREVMLSASGLVDRRATDEVAVAWDRAVTQLDLAA
jgi:predicted transcriptional regulator